MIPVLNNRFMLLKQYGLSCMYPIYEHEDSKLLSSGSYEYDRINQVASEILSLCDGSKEIKDIAIELSNVYDNDIEEIQYMVNNFIKEAKNKDYINYVDKKEKNKINVAGSYETIYPFFVSFEITKKCPLKCKHCFNESGLKKQDELTSKQIIEILYKLKRIGVQKIMLTGGEPLSKPGFSEILKVATQLFIGVSIGTNGYYINEKFVNKISEYSRNMVFQISVDGLETNHDNIRGTKGSFKKAIKAIELLSDANINVIVANTLNKFNFEDIENVTKLVKNKGAKQINYSSTLEAGRARNNNLNEGFNSNKFDSMVRKMDEKYTDESFFVNDDQIDEEIINNKYVSCGAGDTQICIRENGDISPCVHFPLSYGNLLFEEPKDIFNKDRIETFRNVVKPSKKECYDCLKCAGCVAYAVQMSSEECEWKRNNKGYLDFIEEYEYI